jgi:hypothetical protein
MAPERLHIIHRLPRLHEGLTEALEEWLQRHPEARLVVIDTLARIRPPRQRNGDWYAEDIALGEELNRLAMTYHVALVLVHHLNKGGATDPLDQVHGTMGITGSADENLILERNCGEADATLLISGRDVDEQKLALQFKAGAWSILGAAGEYELTCQRKEVLDHVRQEGGPVSPKETATALGKRRDAVQYLFKVLERERWLEAVAYGRYVNDPYGPPHSPHSSHSPSPPHSRESEEETDGQAEGKSEGYKEGMVHDHVTTDATPANGREPPSSNGSLETLDEWETFTL